MRALGWLTASVFAVVVVGMPGPVEAAPRYPKAEGRCVDQTGVLGHRLCAKVTAVLLRDEKLTSDEIAVVVVPNTGDSTIEAWSTGLFNTWGVGKKGKNNGVLLVVALDDHKVRLETGRAPENRIDHGDAVTIVGDITSHFADDEYALGILTGLDDVRRQLGHTVSAKARLVSLAVTAPASGLADANDSDSEANDAGVLSDGSEFTSPDDFASGDDGPGPMLPIAVGGFAVAALVAVAVGRRSSGSASTRRSLLAHDDMIRRATYFGSSDSSGSSFGSSDSSGSSFGSSDSSGSSFGGGSSDGGGATGSW